MCGGRIDRDPESVGFVALTRCQQGSGGRIEFGVYLPKEIKAAGTGVGGWTVARIQSAEQQLRVTIVSFSGLDLSLLDEPSTLFDQVDTGHAAARQSDLRWWWDLTTRQCCDGHCRSLGMSAS